MKKPQFEYKTYGMTMMLSETPLEDQMLEDMGNRYAKALANSMNMTKQQLVASLLGEVIAKRNYEIEVDFDGQD